MSRFKSLPQNHLQRFVEQYKTLFKELAKRCSLKGIFNTDTTGIFLSNLMLDETVT